MGCGPNTARSCRASWICNAVPRRRPHVYGVNSVYGVSRGAQEDQVPVHPAQSPCRCPR